MPKIGMRNARRTELITATIETLAENGSLDVRVSDIAKRAGVSSGLAHHYFGSKDQLYDDSMRYLLVQLGDASAASQAKAEGPSARIDAILQTNFSPNQFDRLTISAWLIFYVRALRKDSALRLLKIYTKRLRSNLLFAIAQMTDRPKAEEIAEGASALIDGLWLRAALGTGTIFQEGAIKVVSDYINQQIAE